MRLDATAALIATAVLALLVIAGNGQAPAGDAAAPPPGGFAHGAAGSGTNGFGGSIAPSPTMRSWPGTGSDGNGGPFSFIGAHYGSMWKVPAMANNSLGVGYCVMEDVGGEGTVSLQADPAAWDVGEMARAAALMSSFGGDRVLPYGIDASGRYDLASGEWQHPTLFGGGEYTRRRHVAVNFGVKMLVEDVSPSGAVAGLKLARDSAVVNGSGGEFSALSNSYVMAKRLVSVAEAQHAVGGVRLEMVWATSDRTAPTTPGTYPLEVRATDARGKPVGFVPVLVLSDIGIDGARTTGATASADRSGDSPDDVARWSAADALGWPTMNMALSLATDRRFAVGADRQAADITDRGGIAHFDVTITHSTWELAFHTQAPTADVSLYAGSGIQGQITWSGRPQSASAHAVVTPPPPPPPPPPPATTPPPAAVGTLQIRKLLDADDVQDARDMSGFEFEVTTDAGLSVSRQVTGADGLTPPIEAIAGTYTAVEVARPPWARSLIDGGPVTFAFHPDSSDHVVEIAYTNVVPSASIATAARDGSDGDQTVELDRGATTIIDTVTYTALVPGTEYAVNAELMVLPGGPDTAVIATGITGSVRFVPDDPDGSVDVDVAVPADPPLAGHLVVVYQQLSIASSGRVVAVHTDPTAAEQTIRFTIPPPPPPPPPPPTTVESTIPPPPTTTAPTPTTTPRSTTPTTTTPVAAAPPPPPTTPPPPPPSGTRLPRTGGDGTRAMGLAALALLLLGAGLLLAVSGSPTGGRPSGTGTAPPTR